MADLNTTWGRAEEMRHQCRCGHGLADHVWLRRADDVMVFPRCERPGCECTGYQRDEPWGETVREVEQEQGHGPNT